MQFNALVAAWLVVAAGPALTVSAQPEPAVTGESAQPTPEEAAALQNMRAKLERTPCRAFKRPANIDAKAAAKMLGEDGLFSDMADVESEAFQNNLPKRDTESQRKVAPRLELAFNRIWAIAEGFRGQPRPLSGEQQQLLARLYRAINHYGAIESKRDNNHGRFHASCFAIPLAAANTYFTLLPEMDAVEAGKEPKESDAARARDTLLAMGYQAWTVPARNDPTDANPVSVERFRKHVLWVGGNSLTYRPVLAVALMHRSVPMLNVLADVASGAISTTSFSTNDKSFWSEGMTVDGSGWAHGRQNQAFAYPFDGIMAALETLNEFKGTPWEKTLTAEQVESLMNYLRGSSWFHYQRVSPPVLDRQNMVYGSLGPSDIRTARLAERLLQDWKGSFTPAQIAELQSLSNLAEKMENVPESVEAGDYRGVRYFWNQDALAAKSDSFYMLANMSSERSDGLESAAGPASGWNFFTDDGHTLFCRDGLEYTEAIGAWNLTALPGVTARQGEDQLSEITNWHGFNSSHNYAGGVGRGENGCAGFIFEKQDGAAPGDTAGKSTPGAPNAIIYGLKAHKAFFIAGNSLLALGAGITDLKPELPGDIWTTINQTSGRTAVSARDANGTELNARAPDGNTVQWTLMDQGATGEPSITHDGFTYRVIPEFTDGTVKASLERRATKWDKLAKPNKQKKTPAQADIFQLWIDHGAHPQGARYAYLVTADDATPAAVAQDPLVVIANNEKLQAVRSADGRIIQAVIYDPSEPLPVDNEGHTVSADTPCVLMIEKPAEGGAWIVTVNDPEQLPAKRSVQLTTDATLTGDGVSTAPDGKSILLISLPDEALLGKPATVRVNLQEGQASHETSSPEAADSTSSAR